MIAVLVCGIAVIALLIAERRGVRAGVAVAKLVAAAAFVAAALSWGATSSEFGRWLLGGLLLCGLGDALLLPPGQTLWFRCGIGAFLLGHIAYALAFFGLGVELEALALATLAVGALALWILRWLRPHLAADFRAPVAAYILVIASMCALAIGASAAGAPATVAIGALAFAASDVSVARERFVAPGFVNSAWGLPLYFGAQLLLAATLLAL